MERAQKVEMVAALGQIFSEAGSVVVTRYTGLSVAEMTDLRSQLKAAGATFKVTKNRLAKIALENTDRGAAADMFVEPTGIAFGADPVAAPKAVEAFAKDNDKLVVVGGLIGDALIDAKGIAALAKMPSIEEMRAKFLGVLLEPGNQLARVLNEPGTKLVRQLNVPGNNLVGVLRAQQAKQEAA